MEFVCYTNWKQLPESANVLFEQAEKDSIFFSRPWFESLTAKALGNEHTLVLACVVAGDKVMAMLPLMEHSGNKIWYSLRHGFTPLYSLLLLDDDQEQVVACLAEALKELPVSGLLLEPVASDDSKLNSFKMALETAGFSCDYSFRAYNWIHRLQGQSYEDYMAARPAHLRNTIARKKRKLEREHGFYIRLYTGGEVPQRMVDYYLVYHASWKQNEVSTAEFQDCFIEHFSRAGWSRLAILYIKEQPVAAQLWFVCHGKASIYRLAYDKAWRRYSTGSILTRFLMEYVIDTEKVKEIDFLTGNDFYKQDWMSERRERFLLGCINSKKSASKLKQFVETLKRRLLRTSK